jgi:sugar phosphate isomerase/epimerase
MRKSPWDMSGKVVLVTGGNAGIGFGFCRGIARAGGNLVIWGRRSEKNREAAAQLADFGTRVMTQEVDVSDEARVIAALSEAVDKLGRVDGVIANAGIMSHAGSFLQMSAEAYHDLLNINQHGASFVNTLRDAVDVAKLTGVGLIVDFGNCWMERDLHEVLQAAAPHISLVQVCDVVIGSSGRPSPGGRVHLGEGELPLHRLMQDVIDTGYSGLFDLEVLGPVIEAEGYAPALRRGVARASSLLEELGL